MSDYYNKYNKIADLEEAQNLIENAIDYIRQAGESYTATSKILDALTKICYDAALSIDELKATIEEVEIEPEEDSFIDDEIDDMRDYLLERKYGEQL